MTWTDPLCVDLDARAAADPGHPTGCPKGSRNERKRERLEEAAAEMRAKYAGNANKRNKRKAAKAAIARKRGSA